MSAKTFLSHVVMSILVVAPTSVFGDSEVVGGAPTVKYSGQSDAAGPMYHFFDDRAAFEVACPGLPLEDFEEGNVGPGNLTTCSDPFDSLTDDDCWNPGDILDGVSLGSSVAGSMVILGDGFLSQPSIATGPYMLAQYGYIDFLPYVSTVGFDLFSSSVPEIVDVRVIGVGGTLIAETQVLVGGAGVFIGARSFEPIVRVEYEAAGNVGEVIDNLTFGSPAPILAGYLDRPSFDSNNPGLPVEDFEEGQVAPGGIVSCAAPINNGTSSAGCFDVGDILPGISFEDDPGPSSDGIAIIGAGWDLSPSIAISNNYFHEALIIDFNPPVRAIGMDLLCHYDYYLAHLRVWGEGGIPLASFTAHCSQTGFFRGLSSLSTIAISTIEIDSGSAVIGGVDNVAFGSPGQIFANGFESGNTSAWSAVVP